MSTAITTQDAAIAKQNNGLATVVAVAQAQRQTAQARYTLAAAEGAERTARANLIAALGVPAATEIDVVDSAELPLPPAPADSVSKAVDQALAHRPDVIAALGKVDAAEATLKGERRSYYPTIELSGQAFQNIGSLNSDGGPYSNINRPGQSIFLSFSVPLFDGGMRRNRISMADAKAREAQEQLAAARDSASQQVVRAYNGLLTSLAEYDAATALSQAAHTAYEAALVRTAKGSEPIRILPPKRTPSSKATRRLKMHVRMHTRLRPRWRFPWERLTSREVGALTVVAPTAPVDPPSLEGSYNRARAHPP